MLEATIQPVNPIIWASQSIRHMLPEVSIAITSTVLAVFGAEINSWFKRLIKKRPFPIRVSAFVLLVAFGYGALTLAISHLLSGLLMQIGDLWLSAFVVVVFIALGVIAEERRQI